jgi:hypothetical protein
MTHPNWLRKEKAARAQIMSDPKVSKQIYGKNFDISNCKCPCKSKDLNYHSKDSKHNAYVKAIEERVRQGEVLDARHDDAIKLAQAYVAANPIVRGDEVLPLDANDDDEDNMDLGEQLDVVADAHGDDFEEEEDEEEEDEEEEEIDDGDFMPM